MLLHHLLIAVRKPFVKLVPIAVPKCHRGAGKCAEIVPVLQQLKASRPLIVTGPHVRRLAGTKAITDALTAAGIPIAIFSEITADPTLDQVRLGVQYYQQHRCDSVIALGGGSPMDCAKGIIASVGTGKDIARLTGLLKVHRRLPPLIAIPTTAGSGSEATVAAVIRDDTAQRKQVITDPSILPKAAILDPELLTGLPAGITAETGMDALTHAVESWLSRYADRFTRKQSLEAIRAIVHQLPVACREPDNLAAREALLEASFKAGVAFTRTYVGNVHAISHQLGGIYQVPHGQANAIVLPRMLEFSLQSAQKELAELARGCQLTDNSDDAVAARVFVDRVKAMGQQLGVPQTVDRLQAADIPRLSRRAAAEAFGVYPVPRTMNASQCQQILFSLLPEDATAERAA